MQLPTAIDDWIILSLGTGFTGAPSIATVRGVPVVSASPENLSMPLRLYVGVKAIPLNAGDWIRAGAVAVGVGTALVDASAIANGDYQVLTANARRIIDNVRAAREQQ